MKIERMGSNIEPIQPVIERLKAEHKYYETTLKLQFSDKDGQESIDKNSTAFINKLASLEDYIASKIQLLNNLQETDAFYEIQAAHIEIAKHYYVELYNKTIPK